LAGAIRNYLLDALFWFEFWFRADNRYKRNLFRSPWSHHFMMVSLHGQVDVTITFMLHLHQCSTPWWSWHWNASHDHASGPVWVTAGWSTGTQDSARHDPSPGPGQGHPGAPSQA
jgi:hypothetical protein